MPGLFAIKVVFNKMLKIYIRLLRTITPSLKRNLIGHFVLMY